MKVLIVEDNGFMSKLISSHIETADCIRVGNYISAVDAWEEYKSDIQCIVLDLAIPAYGLTNEEICRYRPHIGLAFLEKITSNVSEEEKNRIQRMTVIYSGYSDGFKNHIKQNDAAKTTTKNVTIIAKEIDSSGQLSMKHLFAAVNQILNDHE